MVEIRKILEQITVVKDQDAPKKKGVQYDLSFFEGAWRDEISGMTTYAKTICNKLLILYEYGDAPDCPAHFYNCRLIGKTLFARFAWFDEPISGYACLRIVSDNQLAGGWWYSEEIPEEISSC